MLPSQCQTASVGQAGPSWSQSIFILCLLLLLVLYLDSASCTPGLQPRSPSFLGRHFVVMTFQVVATVWLGVDIVKSDQSRSQLLLVLFQLSLINSD